MRTYVRVVLIVLAAFELLLGLWLSIVPRTFYDHVPTVNWTPPYSEHLFRDFGGASLGLGIVLAAAAIRLDRFLTAVALIAFLAYAGPPVRPSTAARARQRTAVQARRCRRRGR